jgi:hypothetical protein
MWSKLWTRLRNISLGFAIGGLAILALAPFVYNVDAPRPMRTVALIVSAAVLVGLLSLTVSFGLLTIRKQVPASKRWAIATIATFVAGVIATMFVLNMSFGTLIRDAPLFSSLPDGNLLVAGGRVGWFYLLFVTVAALSLWDTIVNRPWTRRVFVRSKPSHRDQANPPNVVNSDEAPPKNWSVLSGRDTL